MKFHTFGARPARLRSLAVSSALDFGLRVHVDARLEQRVLFSGVENFSAQQLTSELVEMVSSLRVRSYGLRAQLEHVTTALMDTVRCGSWAPAQRAALDLAGLLTQARQQRLADLELLVRGSNCALRIADLAAKEVR